MNNLFAVNIPLHCRLGEGDKIVFVGSMTLKITKNLSYVTPENGLLSIKRINNPFGMLR